LKILIINFSFSVINQEGHIFGRIGKYTVGATKLVEPAFEDAPVRTLQQVRPAAADGESNRSAASKRML
jgi:hypothetical protein